MSSSVSLAFKLLKDQQFDETAKFCEVFDKFFDCMNTRSMSEGKKKRKPDLDPYRSVDDCRLQVRINIVHVQCLSLSMVYLSGLRMIS